MFFRLQYASTGQAALIAKQSYLFCAFLTAQSGRPCTGGAAEFLALPKALSRSGMPFSSRRKGPISASRLAISSTASRRSLMSGMLRKGLHSHCRSSLLPPAWYTHTHSQLPIYCDSMQDTKHFPVELLFLVALCLWTQAQHGRCQHASGPSRAAQATFGLFCPIASVLQQQTKAMAPCCTCAPQRVPHRNRKLCKQRVLAESLSRDCKQRLQAGTAAETLSRDCK